MTNSCNRLHTLICTTSFTPPFGERCEILNSVRASNLAWLPPTVHSNCSERLWLHAKTFFGCPGESPWLARRIKFFRRRTLPLLLLTTPPLWPPKREYNAVSAIAYEIWQYRTGGNLTIFDKDHDTAEEGRLRTASGSCSQAYGFATITVYSWWHSGEVGFSVFIIARKAWRVPSPPPLPKFVWPNLRILLLLIFYYNKKLVKLNFSIRQVYTNFFLVFSAT